MNFDESQPDELNTQPADAPSRSDQNDPSRLSLSGGAASSTEAGDSGSQAMANTTSPAVHVGSDDCIELRRLHRYFGSTKAVSDISFGVRRGHVFGYIGPNGAGKTTSMRILATLDLPSYGDAFVDGLSVVNDPELVRRRLGFMPDSFGTYRDVNCVEYLDFFARAYGLSGKERNDRLKWVLDFTGTDTMAEKPICGLSKGMKQRLCLGRALVHNPSVIILDEPAAGLDPRARIQLRKMIRELAEQGKTVLISSHILTELAEICDSIGIIEQGQLLATGTVDEIQKQRKNQREITIRILNDAAKAASDLQNQSNIATPIIDGDLIRFAFDGDTKDQASLVTYLVGQGYAVAEITAHQKSLEDVFLQVTEGLVQ